MHYYISFSLSLYDHDMKQHNNLKALIKIKKKNSLDFLTNFNLYQRFSQLRLQFEAMFQPVNYGPYPQ